MTRKKSGVDQQTRSEPNQNRQHNQQARNLHLSDLISVDGFMEDGQVLGHQDQENEFLGFPKQARKDKKCEWRKVKVKKSIIYSDKVQIKKKL